jgi:hypothetical protein
MRQEPDSCAATSIEGVARVVHTEIELVSGGLARTLEFYVVFAAGGVAPVGCVDLVVPVRGSADGSEVVLRRVSVAGCDVTLGEAPVRVVIGFNHEPAPKGRLLAAAKSGDIPAMTLALDDGCSTQETDEVRIM